MNKKALSVILSLLMSVSVFQTPVFATGEEPEAADQEIAEVQENQTTEKSNRRNTGTRRRGRESRGACRRNSGTDGRTGGIRDP